MTKRKLLLAAEEYLARKARHSHPDGSFDNAGRYYLSESERCNCCDEIRQPSRNYPYSEMNHARSLKHVANLYQVKSLDLRRALKKLKPNGI